MSLYGYVSCPRGVFFFFVIFIFNDILLLLISLLKTSVFACTNGDFHQCSGCLQHHKLVDNLGLIVEYDLREETGEDENSSINQV